MIIDRFRYELLLMGRRVILTPLLVMLCFAVFAELLHYLRVNPSRFLSAGIEMILPLAAGVVVATIVSHDPAIELQLTLPNKYHTTAIRRLLLIMTWTAITALLSSAVIFFLQLWYAPAQLVSWSLPWQFLISQLTWLAPLLWFVAVGLCLAMLTRSRTASGALLCGVWLVETLFKDLFVDTAWLRPVFLFPTTLKPDVTFWLTNRIELLITACVLLPLGWLLLHNPEGLLKGAGEE